MTTQNPSEQEIEEALKKLERPPAIYDPVTGYWWKIGNTIAAAYRSERAARKEAEKERDERPTRAWEHSLQMSLREKSQKLEASEARCKEIQALLNSRELGLKPYIYVHASDHCPTELALAEAKKEIEHLQVIAMGAERLRAEVEKKDEALKRADSFLQLVWMQSHEVFKDLGLPETMKAVATALRGEEKING